jgi:adenylate cyclase
MPSRSETSTENPTRELAAIMFSDVVGYTAIMGRDEAAAMRALDAHRQTLRTLFPQFNGRLVGEIGDGTLSSFRSAMDAVNCAREVQAVAQDDPELRLRIGIHLGDIVFANNTVIGDGVNVASRIHTLAPPRGICISASVFDEIRNKPGIATKDLGEQKLKNVSRPIRVYALVLDGMSVERSAPWPSSSKGRTAAMVAGVLALAAFTYAMTRSRLFAPVGAPQPAASRQVRSIAVLPLDNYSGDPNQEYFADGMTDELTTDLASIRALRVISRSSVMQYKGAHRPPMPEIAKALNVDAVIEGSVFREGDRVRITAQLIDAPADKHLWAKSYERSSRDVLGLEDEIASAIAHEVNVQLTPSEQTRLSRARTVNPAAHDAYLEGRYLFDRPSDENLTKAISQFNEAIKLDPNFAPAYSGLSDAYLWAAFNEGVMSAAEAMPLAKANAEKAIRLDDTSAEGHTSLAVYRSYSYDWTGGEREFRRALALNPNYALAHHQFSIALNQQGRSEEALGESQQATQLAPLSPAILVGPVFALTRLRRYDDARRAARALEIDPTVFVP